MKLDDITQEAVRLAIASHQHCVHGTAVLCHALILSETAMRRGFPILSEEELQACGEFIADVTLESLILRGFVEVSGVDEFGDMMVGLTEAGYKVTDTIEERLKEEEDGTWTN